MSYTVNDVRQQFDSATFSRGDAYRRNGHVLKAKLDGNTVQGSVSGNQARPYRQTIRLRASGARLRFDGNCSCPMAHNCKHVVAVLLALCERTPDDSPLPAAPPIISLPSAAALSPAPQALAQWMGKVTLAAMTAAAAPSATPGKPGHRVAYALMREPGGGAPLLLLCKGKLDAGGAVTSLTPVPDLFNFNHFRPDYARAADIGPARLLTAMRDKGELGAGSAPLRGDIGATLLQMLLQAGNLLWARDKKSLKNGLLKLAPGPRRGAAPVWRAVPEGDGHVMKLAWQFDDDGAVPDCMLPTEPPMYMHGGLVGELALLTPASAPALPSTRWEELVRQAPVIALADVPAAAHALAARGLERVMPLPQLGPLATRSDIRPVPVLLLGSLYRMRDVRRAQTEPQQQWHDYALLSFDYDGVRASADPAEQLTRLAAGGIEAIARDAAAEGAARATLSVLGLTAADPGAPFGGMHGALQLASDDDWLHLAGAGLASLRAQGWRIEHGPGFRFELAAVDDWYAQVAQRDGAGSAWFELELGIVVDGANVPLLPVLLQLIRAAPRDFNPAALEARGDAELLLATLPDKRKVALPWGRVKPILRTLGELYFREHIGAGIVLPTLDLARLAELEAGAQLRWLGGEHLRELGRKLRGFEQVQPITAPSGLQASLRGYQADGVAWMQFLREYGLAGILADDMGLGKTIQTLTHILLEKEAGRLSTPALVVAPTSLMSNWRDEAARFTPGLRVLELTGPDRQQRFGDMAQADVVLTSYALLPRDEAALRRQPFHLLILDESQYIKNSRSKAAQTAGLLTARHRLCLTGTPLQNHLGELWSQFHFLMPGLLGDEKTFNIEFRKPIEQDGDSARNAFLVRRIKPFLLRRTKDHVARELPPKTEVVRMVELAGAQRDLYETVRLTMDRKVRDEIARKGAARSQIVILDALLKLRQVCCDPSLVGRIAGVRKGTKPVPSAKLDALLELMDELLDEGRTILVFSQFTSMLALIEAALRERNVDYALLTGDTPDRAEQVARFQRGEVPVFLISLKAGGVGLNLTAADTVIHYDPWWNPAAENQATDRAWRIGQDKPVFVYRLIAQGTLEEKIQELQKRKAGLANAVLAGEEIEGLRITQQDLLGIFEPW